MVMACLASFAFSPHGFAMHLNGRKYFSYINRTNSCTWPTWTELEQQSKVRWGSQTVIRNL